MIKLFIEIVKYQLAS